MGQHILREDIAAVMRRAAGRKLSGGDLAALARCFALDASATISWPEFERSWRALQHLGARSSAAAAGASSRARTKHPGATAAAAPLLGSQVSPEGCQRDASLPGLCMLASL